ncbi:MAG: alkyl sulfatase dimerization domain-containing protein [Deltaproteobacteria bacterium]|nr:alkyl sulfatase dimerization domain-containing protein [Deltaproteobacteria bacterium]
MPDHSMLTTDPLRAQPRVWGDPGEIAPDLFMFPAFVNTYALRTAAGLLLIDPGFTHASGQLRDAVRGWSDAPLHSAVYTHGHVDHAFGLRAFLAAGETPQIVAQENCLDRFRRYALTNGWNGRINQRQFSLPQPMFPHHFDWPTLTFRDALSQRLGGLDVHYHAAKGETDDAVWVWVPEHRYLFTGDLIIWQAPNCGNPQKVQRYPAEWADALEAMAGLGAEYLFPGHGLAIKGRAAVHQVLTETARYLRVIVDQVLELMNAGRTPEEIFHAVEPDPELSTRPYLQANYDHPKFIVRNLLRLWGGWWNGNAADLLPATHAVQAGEIAALAGGVDKLIARGRALLEQGDSVLAAHLAEWATRAVPEDAAAQALKRDVYARRLSEESALMAQGIYRAAMNDARQALKEEPDRAGGLLMGHRER